jgi:hypothetical protein
MRGSAKSGSFADYTEEHAASDSGVLTYVRRPRG